MSEKNVSSKTENGSGKTRAPIVTVMGHVDHGKTSILDAIRKTNIQAKEYGGITQHIGAYQIEHNSQKITFIDTPGHAAFSQMRARGGKAADIVVLVVAADDGVMPQTKEAILHAKAAGVPIIVAINKIDLPGANVQKAKQGLAQENVMVEDWGGDVVAVEVSAKTGQGLNDLLDAILAVSELQNLKGTSLDELEAVIIEAKLDKQKGVVVSAIVRNGLLKVGDEVYASGSNSKIKSLMDDKGRMLKEVGPSTPVEILGFKEVPHVGDLILQKGSELAELAEDENRVEIIGQNTKKTVNLILRADTQGTLEAVKAALASLVTENVSATYSLKFLLATTGAVTDSDILLAANTKGIVVGFNVKISPSVADLAEVKNVPLKTYKAIYELIDEARDMLEGTALAEEKKIKGRAKVLKLFKLPSGDVIAGSEVLAGIFKEGSRVAIFDKNPDDVSEEEGPLYRGEVKKLKMGKDDVAQVGKGNECGILLRPQFEGLDKDMFIEVM